MKKKLSMVIGTALAMGLTAAHAEVTISGYGHVSVDSIKGCPTALVAGVCTATGNSNNTNVSSDATNIVLSASQDLGSGLKGIFSMQNFFKLDQNNGAGSANAMSGGNSSVGLSGSFGTVMAGNWDSGAKQNGGLFDLFRNQIGDSRNADVNANRVANLLAYVSPTMSGFSALVAHSTNADSVGTAANSPALDASVEANSLLLKYAQGPVTVGFGYDKLKPGAGGTLDKWTNLGAKYGLGPTDLIVFYQKHDDIGGAATSENTTTGVGVAHKLGNNTVKFQYYQVDIKVAAGKVKPTLMALGWDHAFSKTFTGYLAYAKADNKTSGAVASAMSMAGGGHGDNPGTVAGQDMSGFGVGAIIKF